MKCHTGVQDSVRRRVRQAARGFAGLLLLGMLGACATTGQGSSNYAALMSQAEAAAAAGQVNQALGVFEDAGHADPVRKEPWVRIAQLRFDNEHYAHAIVAAEEVLQRDPEDLVADGILTVSGFRIATGSLQRLQERDALGTDVARQEAEMLAGTLRETMGEGIFAAGARSAPPRRATTARRAQSQPSTPAAQPRSTPAEAPAAERPSSANPFERIGGN